MYAHESGSRGDRNVRSGVSLARCLLSLPIAGPFTGELNDDLYRLVEYGSLDIYFCLF